MTELVKPPVKLKKRVLSSKQKKRHNFSFGQQGEALARHYLVDQSYEVVAENVRINNHEVDLIALDKKLNELVFIEVKTRQNEVYGEPSTAVDKTKIRSMQIVAHHYCKHHRLKLDYRFDIITVISGKIEHYLNITW